MAASPSGEEPMAPTLLAVLTTRPGQVLTTRQIIAASPINAALGSSRHRSAASVISAYTKRNSGEWSKVRQVSKGRYVYDPDHVEPTQPNTWTEVARDDDVLILRGPDNRLYRAALLAEES